MPKRIPRWEEKEHPTVYANMLGIGMTPFDINVVFGEVLQSDATSISGIPKVRVLLTPEQAQNLIKLLTVAVNTYAKSNGPLRNAGAVDVEELTENFESSTEAAKASE